MARATRKDVAALANVSVATVSHIMNNRGKELGFSPDTERRVRKAAKQLGYIPRASARNFRYQKSRVIALFTTEAPSSLRLPIFNELITSAVETARDAHYFVLPIPVNGDPMMAVEMTLREIELAGAVLRDDISLREAIPILVKNDVPSVWINTGVVDPPDPRATCIVIDEKPGIVDMLNSIDLTSVRAPMLIHGPGKPSGRIDAFLTYFPNAMRIETSGWAFRDGYNVGSSTLRYEPDLIFAASDQLAYGIMSYINDNSQPAINKIRIFGFGDVEHCSTSPSRLSSIEWPLADAARLSIELLVDHIQGNHKLRPGIVSILPTSAHPRASTT